MHYCGTLEAEKVAEYISRFAPAGEDDPSVAFARLERFCDVREAIRFLLSHA